MLKLHSGFLELVGKGWPPPQSEIVALLERFFDLADIARVVLGKHAAAASPAQQARLSRALALRLARESLRYRPSGGDDGFTVTERRSIGAAEWLVMTRAVLPAPAADPGPREPLVLGWRVRGNAQELRIVDVLRDGISAVLTERDDFAAALRRRDLDSVIAEFERRATAQRNPH